MSPIAADWLPAYRLTFLLPAVLMVAALGAFAAGKRFYAVEKIDHEANAKDGAGIWSLRSVLLGLVIVFFLMPLLLNQPALESVKAVLENVPWVVLAALTGVAFGFTFYGIEELKIARSLFGLFALLTFFWMGYEQNDNLWTFFARDHMHRVVDLGYLPFIGKVKWEVPPDGFQSINAALILILVPLFDLIWRKFDPQGKRFPAATKMLAGFVITAAASGVMSAAGFQFEGRKAELVEKGVVPRDFLAMLVDQQKLTPAQVESARKVAAERGKGMTDALVHLEYLDENGVKTARSEWTRVVVDKAGVSWGWIVLAYFVLTVGEILVYGTGLELAFTAAPQTMKSFVTACFLLTNTFGNLVNSKLSPVYEAEVNGMASGPFFAMTAGIVLAASVAFYFVGRGYTKSTA
jgi:dipeptide/tripeptide permease